ncbi:unnamed protein product [Phaeothamnion confervicola]
MGGVGGTADDRSADPLRVALGKEAFAVLLTQVYRLEMGQAELGMALSALEERMVTGKKKPAASLLSPDGAAGIEAAGVAAALMFKGLKSPKAKAGAAGDKS